MARMAVAVGQHFRPEARNLDQFTHFRPEPVGGCQTHNLDHSDRRNGRNPDHM